MSDDFKCRDRREDEVRKIKLYAIINDRIRQEITIKIGNDWFLTSKYLGLEDR